MDALRMMGLGAVALPDSVTNYKIPVPEGPANTTPDVPWWQKGLDVITKLSDAASPIIDQFNKGGSTYNPNLPANTNNGGFTPPPAPTFWDKHGTTVMVGSGLALAAGATIYFASRPKKKK